MVGEFAIFLSCMCERVFSTRFYNRARLLEGLGNAFQVTLLFYPTSDLFVS